MLFCCLGGWKRVVCILDNLNHAVLREHCVRRLCDLHDRYVTADFERQLVIDAFEVGEQCPS